MIRSDAAMACLAGHLGEALVRQQPRQGRPPKSPTLLRHRFMERQGVSV
jgi:hypothetical protein